MKFSRANLLVRRVAGRDAKDPALSQVHIEDDGTTVASNGRAMMAVEPVQEEPQALPDFEEECEPPSGGVGVSLDVIDETLKNLPKGNLALELGYAVLTGCDLGEREAKFTTTDLNKDLTVKGKTARARFPEWRGVLRSAKRAQVRVRGGVKICVDRKELIALVKALDEACPSPDHEVFLELAPGEEQGLLLRAVSAQTRQQAIGYLLPIDTGDEWLPMNKWERGVMARTAKRRKRKEKEDA